jgi:hypothetical protein
MKRAFLISLIVLLSFVITSVGCTKPAPVTIPGPPSETSPTSPQQSTPTPNPNPTPAPSQTKVMKNAELKYDDGKPNQWAAAVPTVVSGFLIDFTPPATPFTIKKVRILGMLFGTTLTPNFDVEILDSDKNIINSVQQPIDVFPSGLGNAEWVNIDIPDVEVNGKFYVHVYTNTGHNQGIHIGWDDSVPNEHSSVSTVSSSGVIKEASWPYPDVRMSDQSKVNWMIRVVGTYEEPGR